MLTVLYYSPKLILVYKAFILELFNKTSFHTPEIWTELPIGLREKCFSQTQFHTKACLISCPQSNLSLCGGQWEHSLRNS